jgi:hypothetical protein
MLADIAHELIHKSSSLNQAVTINIIRNKREKILIKKNNLKSLMHLYYSYTIILKYMLDYKPKTFRMQSMNTKDYFAVLK